MRITASQLDRIARCPASATLPRVERPADEHASWGIALHSFLHDVSTSGREVALERVAEEHRGACEAIDLSKLPAVKPEQYAAEVALAVDWKTGMARELGRGGGRNYSGLGPTEIPGTADVIGLEGSDGVVVYDYKSGFRATLGDYRWQLRFLALAAARAYGRSRATIGIVRVTEGGSRFDLGQLDAFDLDETLLDLRSLIERDCQPVGQTPDVVLGPWCKRCPCFEACPGQTALIRRVSSQPASVDTLRHMLTPENAADAYAQLEAVKLVVKRVDAALHAYATEHPFSLPDGRVYGPRATSRETIAGDVAYQVLRDRFGQEVADAGCSRESSKAALERALKPVAAREGEKFAPMLRGVLEAIRAAGGVEEKSSVRVEAYWPAKEKE